VPIFAFLIYRRSIPGSVWASAAAAVTGTFLLCRDGSAFNSGDAWSLAAAAASAMFILRLESHGKA
jgi:drug/metabolite transporter (DMT)-like permease